MKGIYFINDRVSLTGLSKEESISLQEQSIKKFLADRNIQIVNLNPYQLNEYYTIPHALLYDLKKEKSQFDCFIYYSQQTIEDFIYTYPARWLILKSFFKEVLSIEKRTDWNVQDVI